MKIGIQTWGSNGDIRPMIALADGLRRAGHQITLVVTSLDNRSYVPECTEFDIHYRQIPEQLNFDLEGFAQQSFRMNAAQWLVKLLEVAYFPYEDEIYQASQQLASENDVLIGHHFLYPLKIAAKSQGKPFYSVTFCHGAVKSKSRPPVIFPDLGPIINPFQWRLLDYLFDFFLKKKLTRLWNREGMPEIKHVLSELLTSDALNLVAVDSVFCPEHAEWPHQHKACGFLNLPLQNSGWKISPSLQAFLDAGSAPVYMTFGSLQQAVPEWSMALFIEATRLAGCRAIIQTSSDEYPADSQLDDIYFIGRHPHQLLFPFCAAVVHHGGAGTTHSASLCGRPSVVVPFMDEQMFWARTLQRQGLAGKPIHAQSVNETLLANAVTFILSNPDYQQRAEKRAIAIRKTNGVDCAVNLIERALKNDNLT